jgi:hypothetical protein
MRYTHILGESAPAARPEARQITVDFVSDSEMLNFPANRGNSSRYIGTQNPYLWRFGGERKSGRLEHLPIPIVD